MTRIRQAIQKTIEGARQHNTLRIYVSPGRPFGGYEIYSVLLLAEWEYTSHPLLRRTSRDNFSIVPSLLDAVANKFVEACADAILSSFAGNSFATLPQTENLLRAAGTSFMYTPFLACGKLDGLHGGFEN